MGLIVQAVPRGGGCGSHRHRLVIRHGGRNGDGEVGVAGDERPPTAIGGEAADAVAHPMVGDIRADGSHRSGEVHTQLRQSTFDGREQAHRDQDIGEVDTGHHDGDLDLARPRRNPLAGNQFQCLQVAG